MKSRQFLKMLQESKILDGKNLTKSKAEIIFASTAGRKGMSFDMFFKSLYKIAKLRYPTIPSISQALDQIINFHLLPLKDQEMKGKMPEEGIFSKLVYEEDVKIMLNSVFPVLKDIYDNYFGMPFKKGRILTQIIQIASKQILLFARDYDILKNSFVSKQTIISMLEYLVQTPDDGLTNNPNDPSAFFTLTDSDGSQVSQNYGIFFTLNRFFIFLFWVAIIGFDSVNTDSTQYSQAGIELYY